jgi:uncharacterized membrane protein
MSALTLTSVLLIVGIGAIGCLAVSVAIVAWFIRDYREHKFDHPVRDWTHLKEGS